MYRFRLSTNRAVKKLLGVECQNRKRRARHKQQNDKNEEAMTVVTPAQLEDKIKQVRLSSLSVAMSGSVAHDSLLCLSSRPQELGAIHVEAEDLSDGCGSKFSLIVVHDGFEGAFAL